MKMTFKSKCIRALLPLAAMAWGTQAHAAPPSGSCGVTGTAVASTGIYYDPFGTTGLQQATIPLTLTRTTGSGGAKTQEVYFVLTQPAGSPAYQVQATEPGGSTYTNVLYYENAVPANLPTISTNTSGQIAYIFGGASQPDTATFNILVTVPPGTDLSAGKPITFGIRYVCKGTGGLSNVETPTDQSNAVTIDVHVLSALRTYYAGSTLDFGEIGNISTASLGAAPRRTSPSNYVSVLSSGAYGVTLSSANGFLLKKPGAATADDQVAYQLKFLGMSVDHASNPTPGTTAISRSCQRAGLNSGNQLYIQGTLEEGGQGKNPSPTYSDTLTITVTPLISTDSGTDACGSYSVP
ncbi:hypothetical protein [Novosphingobium malaysiense]|uniref:Lipoprotein n=1 Tax=Novosphingobium malaysiense TaxID=1348853 RepID=A0A0B1ZWL7_9SPHN|nr:hypothetical protein [Novosphingobium malaysiense]KHK93547.1 hypothetical protein LK12_04680 [Novosphingobium malaysiense]